MRFDLKMHAALDTSLDTLLDTPLDNERTRPRKNMSATAQVWPAIRALSRVSCPGGCYAA
jgi:hypothetical protein